MESSYIAPRKARILLAAILISFAGCASVIAQEKDAARVGKIYSWFESYGANPAHIRRTLGATHRTVVRPVKPPYGQGTLKNHEHDLYYPGMRVTLYHVNPRMEDGGKWFVKKMDVSNSKYAMKYGLRVGATRDHVRRVLGKPTQESPTLIRYDINYGDEVVANPRDGDSHIIFRLKRGVVATISALYFID